MTLREITQTRTSYMPMLQKLSTSISDTLSSWWRHGSSHNDPTRLLLISSLLVLAVSCLIKNSRHKHHHHPPLPPGPRGLPLVGHLLSLDPDHLHTQFTHLARTYGPIFTVWFGQKLTLVVTCPAIAREILRKNDVIFANHDVTAAAALSGYGSRDIAWSPYGVEWRLLKKLAYRGMVSAAALDSVYSLRRREIRKTIGYVYGRVGSPVNVGEQTFLTILNVITNMLWGGDVAGEEDREIVAAEFRRVIGEAARLLGYPNVSDYYPGLARFDLQGIEREMKGVMKLLDDIFDKMIDQRLKMDGEGGTGTGDGKMDFLQFLLELKDTEEGDANGTPLTMIQVKALLVDMVVGGTATTTNTLEFAMAELMTNPKVMERVRQELDTVVGKNNIVEESHISKLPFLYAVMKEALRLHPILPLMVPRVPSETRIIAGYTIPKGARVFINAWAIHRDPLIWENPLEFDPNRFLVGKWDTSGKDCDYLPFGTGRRICPGILMAERMFMFLLGSLLHTFDWKLPGGVKLDLSEKFGIVMKKKMPLVAIPTPRSSNPALHV